MNREDNRIQSILQSQVKDRNTTVKFKDVWSKYKIEQERPRKFKLPKMGLVACLVLLIATPVGANVYFNWHNLEIVTDDTPPTIPPEQSEEIGFLRFEDYPMFIKSYKNLNLKEAQKLAPFKIMRPLNFDMPLELSAGVFSEYDGDFNAYWDLFHEGNKWVYTRQTLDERSNEMLNEEEMKVTFHLPPESEVLRLKEKDAIAILSDFESRDGGKRIDMLVKNNKDQVIIFEIRGNIGEEELIKLANSYSEQ